MEQHDRPDIPYLYNPTTGYFLPENPSLGYGPASLEELSNGQYTIRNYAVVDQINGGIAGYIATNRDTRIIQRPSGHLEMYVDTPISEVNRRFYANAGHAVGAEFDYEIGGIARHFELDYSRIGPPGMVLAIRNNGENWKEDYRWLTYHPDLNDTAVNAVFSGGRIASTDEAVEYMFRGLIGSQYEETLREMIAEGLVDETGSSIDTVSGAAAFLVKQNIGSVRAARFTFLGLVNP